MYVGLLMVQWICLEHNVVISDLDMHNSSYLYFGFEDEVSVASVCETKYASKLIHGEITNIPNF